MGITKRMWEEEQDRGYSSNDGITVCLDCFEESGISRFIKEYGNNSSCSYCDSENEIITCELDVLIEHILVSVQYEWGNPADEGLPYETREGGWQVSNVYDTWDLLDEIGLGNLHGKVYEDICNSTHNQEWCERDPYSLSTDRTLIFGWNKFSDFVKTKARYVFLRAENPDYDVDQHDEMDPVKILDSLEAIINHIGLVKEIDTNTEIRRVRIINLNETLSTAKDLGSPPYLFATMANRMSPAGIPMFYGAFDLETAIKETYEPDGSSKKAISGVFTPVRNLSVIDLSEKLYIPSLFDEHERENRDYMRFLFDFMSDFTKPIERNDKAHVDYVPTQVVTEYFRHIFRNENKNKVDGVIYPSSKNEGEKAIVIFANSDQCVELKESGLNGAILKLSSIETHALK